MRALGSAGFACLVLLSCLGPGRACNTPVFRYALERWRVDLFELFVVHRGPLTAEQKKLIEQLEGGSAITAAQANVAVRLLDTAAELSREEKEITAGVDLTCGPVLVVWPPWMKEPLDRLPLIPESVSALLDSPARRELARRLLKGDSAVCLLVTSGDAGKDEEARKKLTALAARLEKDIKLPEPDAEDLEAMRRQVGTTLPPLALRFSVQVVAAAAAEERYLIKALRQLAPEGATLPLATWVFGRGRFLWPVALADKDCEEILEDDARYLCGPCSCQVKAQNPGADLLMSVSWDALIDGEYVVDEDLPPLQSVGALLSPTVAPSAGTPAEPAPGGVEGSAPAQAATPPADAPGLDVADGGGEGKLGRSVLWTVAGVAALVLLGSGLILLRGKGGS